MIHLIIFVLCGLVWCTGSAGAEEIRTWTAFRQEDGLGANPVMAGLQARDGTIWFATAGGGVSRYDGRVWQTYTVADGLPGNWVLDLREASDGRIWAAIGRGLEEDVPRAVAQFVDGAWQAVPMPEQAAGRFGTRQIQGLEGGMACVVSLQGQMAHYNGAAWQVVSRSEGRPLRGVQCLYRTQDGTLWVAYTSRRQRGARGRGLEGRRGRRLGGGRRGGLGSGLRLFGGGDRLGLIDPSGQWQDFPDQAGLEGARVLTMTQAPDGAMWFGTETQGVLKYQDGVWTRFTTDDGLPMDRVEVVRALSDGSVWVGTQAGAARYGSARKAWQVFTEREGLPNSRVRSIWPGSDGSVWVGTLGGVARYATTGWVHHARWKGIRDGGGVVLTPDASGDLWAATGEGIYRLQNNTWHSMHRFERRGRIVDLVVDSRGALWGAHSAGLLRYNGTSWEALRPGPDIRPPIFDLVASRQGCVWINTPSGVFRFDGTHWTGYASDIPGRVREIGEGDDGSLWLGLEEGVVRISEDGHQQFTVEDGLPEGEVQEIASVNGQIWVSTLLGGVARFDGQVWLPVPDMQNAQFNGVLRISSARDSTVWLASRLDGAIRTDGSAFSRYSLQEGLPGSLVWDVCQDADGQFWFATDGGLACYAPDGEAPSTRLLLPPGEVAPFQSVLLEFAGQDAWKKTPFWSLQYSWRLDGGPWTPFDREDRVFLKRLPSGTHRFEVRAMDMAFNVEPMPAVHTFVVLAPVWKRPWFVASSLAAFLAVAVSSFYAIQRHRRWKAAQARLIEELEAELQEAHDMQMGLLPRDPVQAARFEVAGRCVPANHVGGDYYQYFWLNEGPLLGFGAADVSGKAMTAAVRAMQLSGIFRYEFREARPPLEILNALHGVLEEQLDAASFITCCLGVLDTGTGRVCLGNAAHPYPYHYSARGGDLRVLDLPSVPLGLTLPPGVPMEHEDVELTLEPGDLLVLYSDGATDMQNEQGDFYEEDRLEAVIQRHVGGDVEVLIEAVISDLFRFKGQAAQADDVTLLVIRALPEERGS